MAPIAIHDSATNGNSAHSFPVGYAAPRECSLAVLHSSRTDRLAAETKSQYKIAQIGADGIGPEVIEAGVRVVHAAAKKLGSFKVDFTELDWSSDRYKKTGSYVPDDYIKTLKEHDAIL